jgi:SpoVK/Ycf46/Vps4 family AAA+-type ATPase
LFPINIGELTAEDRVVSRLQKIFEQAARWDAVLLLDEADVILEKRSYEDLRRNGIVSGKIPTCPGVPTSFLILFEVFLRMLEYYEGILFLATNRLETMDVAFQSRIHVPVKYEPLDSTARRQILKNFIMRIDERESEGKRELLEALDNLQHWELNGREIRNVLSVAESLALSSERRRGALRYKHVEDVANSTITFHSIFENRRKEKNARASMVHILESATAEGLP